MIKIKTLLKEYSILKPTQVKSGMIGTDYNDEEVEIIRIVPARNWKQLKKYDTSGWMYNEKEMSHEYEIDFKTDYLVAVELLEHGNEHEVFVYGEGGVDVPAKKMEEAKYTPETLKASARNEDIESAQNNIETEYYELDNQIDKFKEFINNEIKNLPKQYRVAIQAEVSKAWNNFHKPLSNLMPALLSAFEAGLKKK
jgi:hypothetical protein